MSESFKKLCMYFFGGNIYTQCGARTHDPKVKSPETQSRMLFQMSQPGTTPLQLTFLKYVHI